MHPFTRRASRHFLILPVVALIAVTACDRDSGTSPGASIATSIDPLAWPDTLVAGQQVTFQAAVLDQRGDTMVAPQLSWSNSAPSVLSIQTLGNGDSVRVTALRAGSTTVTVIVAGAQDTVRTQATVEVVLAGARIIAPTSPAMIPAPDSQMVVSARAIGLDTATIDSAGLTWTHDTAGPVSVTPFAGGDSATVRATAFGSDTVTVTAPHCVGTCAARLAITVGHGVASVDVAPATDTLHSAGATTQLVATARKADQSAVDGVVFTWQSSDSTVVTVDSTGLVTAEAAGVAQVSATAEGVQGTSSFTVVLDGPPAPGGDMVVFNDMNMFEDDVLQNDSNNVQLVKNLVSYTASGAHASGTNVVIDYGHAALCNGCLSLGVADSTIASLGYSVTIAHTAQGDLTSIPDSVKVIVLWTPTQTFTDPEINALKLFAQHGGRIVFVGEFDGYYGEYFPVENAFLSSMGAQMTNIGGTYACTDGQDLPDSSLRATQVTTGLDGLTMECSSEVSPGPNDFIFAYDVTGVHALAGVAHIDTTPLQLTAAGKHPFSRASVRRVAAPIHWAHPGTPNR